MEVECSRHLGASTIGSQLREETLLPWLGNPGNPATGEGRRGTCHTDIVYTVGKGRVGGGNPENMLQCRMALQQTRGIHAHRLINCTGLPTTHAPVQVHNGTQTLFVVNFVKLHFNCKHNLYLNFDPNNASKRIA